MSATASTAIARPKSADQPPVRRRTRAIAAAAIAVTAGFAGVSACAPASSNIVTLARQQEGRPYKYGGAGPYTFDCSGLVQYVYREAGRIEPRTAQQQYNASRHISVSQAQPGDLVFWGAPRGVYHVGIYVGGGQMIDAAHTGTLVRQERIWPGASYGRPIH